MRSKLIPEMINTTIVLDDNCYVSIDGNDEDGVCSAWFIGEKSINITKQAIAFDMFNNIILKII